LPDRQRRAGYGILDTAIFCKNILEIWASSNAGSPHFKAIGGVKYEEDAAKG